MVNVVILILSTLYMFKIIVSFTIFYQQPLMHNYKKVRKTVHLQAKLSKLN